MPFLSRKILTLGFAGTLILAIIVLACAKHGLLHTSIAKLHQPAESLRLPPTELPSSQELRQDIVQLRSLRDNLAGVKRSGSTLDLDRFLHAVSQMREVEQSLGLIGQAYEGLKENGEFWLKPRKWARISLESYCLNSGLASPVSNELYSIDKMPAKYEDWLPPLLNYTRTHPDRQRKVQHLVWKLSRGAEYQDLNDEEKKLIKEAIPDFTKPFSGLVRFFKGWVEDWKTLFQDITQVEADLDQRKSKLLLSEPPTRWLLLKNGLGIRVDHADSYQRVYLTVVNLNLLNQKTQESAISFFIREALAQETEEIGEALVFNPSQYILEPGRQDVQPLGMAPVWGDRQLGEAADLLSQIHNLLKEIGVSVIPGVNDVVDFYEFLFGKDYLSGRELTPFERSLSAVGLVIGSGHGYRKGGEKVKELIQEGIKRGTVKEGTGRGATQALEQAGKYLSERVVKFSDAKTLRRHFREHGKEIGAATVVEYETKAAQFLSGSPAAGVLERVRRNGDIVRYNPLTEEFGVTKLDGTIRTYFKLDPKVHGHPTNRAYFEAQ